MTHTWKNGVEGKECSVCHAWKPMDEYYSRKDAKDGYRSNCKDCVSAWQKRRYRDNRDEILAKNAVYRERHREELREYFRQRYRSDPAASNRQTRAYYRAHKEEVLNACKKYRANHREEHRAETRNYARRHRAECRERLRRWRKDNPDVNRAAKMRRRALEANAPGAEYTTGDMIAGRKALYGDCCYLCGARATAVDHVKPLSRGGSHYPCNLRPICANCNSRKGSIWPYQPAKSPSFPEMASPCWARTG